MLCGHCELALYNLEPYFGNKLSCFNVKDTKIDLEIICISKYVCVKAQALNKNWNTETWIVKCD